jgi:hypothetical protein
MITIAAPAASIDRFVVVDGNSIKIAAMIPTQAKGASLPAAPGSLSGRIVTAPSPVNAFRLPNRRLDPAADGAAA